ncbi:N-acyl-D-amino-acid deacylase family protein [Phenylobacterium soli]|uniref:N-acyl-D-amino-acid deacylase family protein n=1 Tax=Phenylobacterium soli TaxID=2170551 RepID=UPI001403E416|nr:amidohydrolase family protein [Phenylobacterium soli]
MHDIVIRGGTIVDGTGAAPVTGDLAIDGGLISAVGRVEGQGRREIDAAGCIVAPGFIDLHTHLDAQVGWDPAMTPIAWHGVTTALIGNCGLTFAPCKPSDRAILAGMMETVEDIPREAILSGLPWSWEAYEEYLDTLDSIGPGLNVVGLVGHSALRYYVMGERSFDDQATPTELGAMCAVMDRAMARGALGFSTNRFEPHKAPDGRSIPGTFADVSELIAIARVVAARGGLVQAVGAHPDVLRELADATGVRILFSYGVGPNAGDGRRAAGLLDGLCEGRDITAITHVRGTGYLYNLMGMLPFRGPAWEELRARDSAGRMAAVRDGAFAGRLVAEARSRVQFSQVFDLGDGTTPVYAAADELSVEAQAAAAGETVAELMVRRWRETDGRAFFNYRMFSPSVDELSEVIRGDHCFPGLGDAGAHVAQVMDGDWPSFILAYWVRERRLFSLAEGVRRMTSGPARVLGLADRGVLAPGKRADVAVFDFDQVSELQPTTAHDFPGGAPRYIQRGRGYRAVLVNGEVSLENDELTGVRSGRVLRPGEQERRPEAVS